MSRTITLSDDFSRHAVERDDAPVRPTFLQRLLAAMVKSREKTAQREIERLIRLRGGVLTDDLEREIGRRFGQLPNG
jgi:hypothetical protein